MNIKIGPDANSCVLTEIPLELSSYTVFAGENNNGKSTILRLIRDHDDFSEYKTIYVPAENIQPQNTELKNTAASDHFYKLLKTILTPIFDRGMLGELINKFDNSAEKNDFVRGVNEILSDLGVDKKQFDIKISEEKFKEDIIIKITKAFVRDLYKTDIDEVDFEKIGIGTQRLVVAALIRYYEEKNLNADDKLLVIFEEPEAYLHPKWKESLYNSLQKLSQRINTIVLVSTHDPHFIELSKDQKIYKVSRDNTKKDTTIAKEIISPGILKYRSDAEINFHALNFPSKVYFLQLYEHAKATEGLNKSYWEFDNFIFTDYFQHQGWIQSEKDDQGKSVTALTRLRHDIAHGKSSNQPITLETAILEMINFIERSKKP